MDPGRSTFDRQSSKGSCGPRRDRRCVDRGHGRSRRTSGSGLPTISRRRIDHDDDLNRSVITRATSVGAASMWRYLRHSSVGRSKKAPKNCRTPSSSSRSSVCRPYSWSCPAAPQCARPHRLRNRREGQRRRTQVRPPTLPAIASATRGAAAQRRRDAESGRRVDVARCGAEGDDGLIGHGSRPAHRDSHVLGADRVCEEIIRMAAQAGCQPREQGDRLDGRTGGEHGLLDEPTVVDRQGVAERRHPDRPDRRHPIAGRTTRHGAEVHPRRPTEIAGRWTLEHHAHRRLPRRRRPRGASGERRRPPRGVDDDPGPESRAVAELHDVVTAVGAANVGRRAPSDVRSRRGGGSSGLGCRRRRTPGRGPGSRSCARTSRRAPTSTASPCRRQRWLRLRRGRRSRSRTCAPRVRRARPAATSTSRRRQEAASAQPAGPSPMTTTSTQRSGVVDGIRIQTRSSSAMRRNCSTTSGVSCAGSMVR